MANQPARRAALAVGSLLIAACGGGTETPSGATNTTSHSDDGTALTESEVRVTSRDGAVTLIIPPGAMPASINPSIEIVDDFDDPAFAGLDVLGDVYELGPDGMDFLEPVTIERTIESSEIVEDGLVLATVIVDDDGIEAAGDPELGSTDDGRLVHRFTTTHFSRAVTLVARRLTLGVVVPDRPMPVGERFPVGAGWELHFGNPSIITRDELAEIWSSGTRAILRPRGPVTIDDPRAKWRQLVETSIGISALFDTEAHCTAASASEIELEVTARQINLARIDLLARIAFGDDEELAEDIAAQLTNGLVGWARGFVDCIEALPATSTTTTTTTTTAATTSTTTTTVTATSTTTTTVVPAPAEPPGVPIALPESAFPDPVLQPQAATTFRDAIGNIYLYLGFQQAVTEDRLRDFDTWSRGTVLWFGPPGNPRTALQVSQHDGELIVSMSNDKARLWLTDDGGMLWYTGLNTTGVLEGELQVTLDAQAGPETEHHHDEYSGTVSDGALTDDQAVDPDAEWPQRTEVVPGSSG